MWINIKNGRKLEQISQIISWEVNNLHQHKHRLTPTNELWKCLSLTRIGCHPTRQKVSITRSEEWLQWLNFAVKPIWRMEAAAKDNSGQARYLTSRQHDFSILHNYMSRNTLPINNRVCVQYLAYFSVSWKTNSVKTSALIISWQLSPF